MCNEAVCREPYTLRYAPDHLKTQEMCEEVMRVMPTALPFIPDCLKTQEMCIKGFEVDPWQLYDVPGQYKTQQMCNKAVRMCPCLLNYAPYWFVTQGQLKIWHYDIYYCDDGKIIRWHEDHQKRKIQKAKIKEELLPIAWHPDRVMDWCMSEEEKGWWK